MEETDVRFFILVFLLMCSACSPYRIFKKDYITLSESPCVDGTILNMDQAGCESFYWGTDPEGATLKVRCTYSPNTNFWTTMDFYAIPHGDDITYSNWGWYCEDRYVKMYATPRGTQLRLSQ
jgi:hypothetical protein